MRGIWRDGLCDEVGLSNCAAWQAAQTSPIVDAIQVLYSLGKRQAEVELIPFAAANEVRVFAYSAFASDRYPTSISIIGGTGLKTPSF
jgi:aryl-alcohol dehydrogenase-like predicted oxidoreductase